MDDRSSTTSTQTPGAMDIELAPRVGFEVQREKSIGITVSSKMIKLH